MAAAGSMTGPTVQQRKAIDARGVSVALSAGAGCGKTFVLTERFLSCLAPDSPGGPLRLDQLTAITFTERAAREMRERIRTACTRRLMECPENAVEHWLRTIRDLDSARISTIHSFCTSLLRSHAVEARLDPQFTVLEQSQTDTLLFELIDRELRGRLAKREEAVLDLVVRFGLDGLREMIRRLMAERQEIDWDRWRAETPAQLAERWAKYWRSDALPRMLAGVSDSPAARQLLAILREHTPTHPEMRARCDLVLDLLPNLPTNADPIQAMAALREAAQVKGGGGKKAWPTEAVYDSFRDAAAALRKDIDRIAKQLTFDPDASLPAAEAALEVLHVADEVAQAFDAKKQELAALDFNDLLIRARDLLLGPDRGPLRKRLAAQTRLLLVDEFQDTDPLQVDLVKALCDGHITDGKLFFVGDHKQSIYRFRGADPRVFRRLRDEMPAEGRLPLSLNFRSQPAVLDFVNALFAEELAPDYEPLVPSRPQVSPTPAVEFLWAVEPEAKEASLDAEGRDEAETPAGDDSSTASQRIRRREADWIARRIHAMLDSGEKIVWDQAAAKAGRPAAREVRPGDIALLFRALSNVEFYEEALRRYDIDYYLVGGHAFYAQQEIYDVVNLLRTLVSPCDEVSLAGVLRSPMFGLLDDTLYLLAQHPEGLSAGLFAQRAGLPDAQRRRVEFAAATLTELRAVKDRVPIAQILQDAIARTGYDAVVLAEFLGERKLANLHKLIEQARSFDASGIFTLSDFMTQLSQFVARQPDEPLAPTQPESLNAVRLMTIHQSKGLEFPVVVVPDIDRRRRVASPSVAFTPELGPMVRMADVVSGYDLFVRVESDEELAELTRLLYVATTRAADYLILSSGLAKIDSYCGPWTQLLARRFDPQTGMAIDGASSVHVKVTTIEPEIASKSSGRTARPDWDKLLGVAHEAAVQGRGRVPEGLAPVPVDLTERRQYSFSRLRGTLHARRGESHATTTDDDAPLPTLDPRGLGTLVHAALAELSGSASAKHWTSDRVSELVQRHAKRHLPDVNGGLEEPIGLIARFLQSARWTAMTVAADVYAELEFLLRWPPGDRRADAPYLQGFIDCLYRDTAGGWHLLDYKTNQVAPERIADVAAEYEMQMLAYALATERILGCPPVELTLHFLRPGIEYSYAWNDDARARAIEMIDRAMRESRESA